MVVVEMVVAEMVVAEMVVAEMVVAEMMAAEMAMMRYTRLGFLGYRGGRRLSESCPGDR